MTDRIKRTLLFQAIVTFIAMSTVIGCSDRMDDLGDSGPSPSFDAGPHDTGSCCEDLDVDTICDSDEGRADLDRDGVPNREDLDSDGDGFSDAVEAGRTDLCAATADHDGDEIPDYLDDAYPGTDAGVPDAGGDDAGMIVEDLCPAEIRVLPNCVDPAEEGLVGLCDGADNDCDGIVDEQCSCEPGTVQRCFRGSVGLRSVGACTDGTQRCESLGEFGGVWGPCLGGISPRAEACDMLDNDCNGCTDELEGCVPAGSCPGPTDPRVPEGRPFSRYELRGGDFFTAGDAIEWQWEVRGSPCDEMFRALPGSTATSTNGQLSYRLLNATMRDAAIEFSLSGDYTVTLTVTRADGSLFTCTWVVHVRGPGLRVELCWDQTGPAVSSSLDIDLHMGRVGTTPRWFTPQDCDYLTCKAGLDAPDWFYADTPIENCTGPGSRGGFTGSCPNPRLDVDNISERGSFVPENINLDNPRDGDVFRVMVHHYGADRVTNPLVNVYCGGELRATFGAAPDLVTDFDEGAGRSEGSMWRVADIAMSVSDADVDCEIRPIHPPLTTGGYHVTVDDSTF